MSTSPSEAPVQRTITYREAIREALVEEMRDDPTVVMFGEDVAAAGGGFKVTQGLLQEFGSLRVRDTPISENVLMGAAIGCAASGFKPVVEIMFADFLANAFDQLVNHAAKLQYMSGGQLQLPLVVRTVHGGAIGFGAQHSQAATSWLLPFPGLKIVAPATPADAKVLLKSAIRDPNPVVFFEHKALYGTKGVINDSAPPSARIGQPSIARTGSDVTIVAMAGTVPKAVAAADRLVRDGIESEVIDLRGLVPLEFEPILSSLSRTGRLIVVEEEPAQGGWADRIVSQVVQRAWATLRTSPRTVSAHSCPIPYAPVLEEAMGPTVEMIVRAANDVMTGAPN